jgi:hypothetical protein
VFEDPTIENNIGVTTAYLLKTDKIISSHFNLRVNFAESSEEYGNLLIDAQEENGYVCSDLKNENGLYYFEYQVTQEDGTTGYFKEYVYESEEAFWGVSFVCVSEDDYVANYNLFPEWAKSVTFNETV